MAGAHAVHYLLIRDFLEPFANKFGATSSDWQLEVFNDLSHDGQQIRYAPSTARLKIEIVGKRFWCRATGDDRREDTLFVFELHRVTGAKSTEQLRTVDASWQLSRGERRMPQGQRITQVPCFDFPDPSPRRRPITLTPTHELAGAVTEAVRTWGEDRIEQLLSRPAPANKRQLLEAMRSKFRSPIRAIAKHLPIEEGERLILNGTRTPADTALIGALFRKFGVPLVEVVRSQQPGELPGVLEALIDLPPPEELVTLICSSWIAARPDEGAAREQVVAHRRTGTDAAPRLAVTAPDPGCPSAPAAVLEPEDPRSDPKIELRLFPEGAIDPLGPPAPPSAVEEAKHDRAWLRARLVALRGESLISTRPQMFRFADSILQLGEELNETLSELPELRAAARVRAILDRVPELCTPASQLFPTGDQLELLDKEVEQALNAILALGELGTAYGWLERIPDWMALGPVLEIARSQELEELPNWFFRELAPLEPSRPEAVMGALADDQLRPTVEEAIRWLGSTRSADPSLLADLRAVEPGTGETPLARLQSAVDARTRQKRLRARFDELQSLGSWAASLWDSPDLTHEELVRSLEELHRQLEELVARGAHVQAELVGLVAEAVGLHDAHERLQDIETMFARLDDLVGDLPSLSAMRRAFAKMQPRSAPPTSGDTVQQIEMELSHCVSDGAVRAARLIARPGPEAGLFLTDIPFHIKSSRRRSVALQLKIEAPHLADRPAGWRALIEHRLIEIPEAAWFQMDRDQWAAPLILTEVPVVRTKGELSLAISGGDARAGVRLKRVDHSWPAPQLEMPSLDLPFSDTTSAEEMQRHPLGIQLHFDDVLQTIKNGRASFLVAAPRRFGKTTLLTALCAATGDSNVVVVGPIRSSIYASVSDAFEAACKEVNRQLGAYVSTEWKQAHSLPLGDTFDKARKAARVQKKTAIYLLFDEAQALFRWRGRETAERLKVLLETAWGISEPELAPIRLGLVGQLHLPRMIQGQLEGMFAETIQKLDIDPLQIQRLLRESTRDVMQSTSDARQLLARVSRNLYILKLLLAEIRRTLIQEQRTWFLRSDVENAVATLIDQALQTSSTQLVSYLRDALNNSYDLTQWQPVPAYLVAVAWAVALADAGPSLPARIDCTRALIEEWARQITPRSSVPIHRIEESLRELHDLAVLDEQDNFRSDLLARYFERLGRGSFQLREDTERQAMQKLLVDVVTLPEAMEEIGSGGQARIYYCDANERPEAIRVVDLPADGARVAFVETCYALKAIEGTRSRHAGYLSLPVVRQAGLVIEGASEDQRLRGAVRYDWVTGSDLGSRRDQLPDTMVVGIGRAMAEALAVLEQRRVVHRDIRLENVVLGPGGIPVLVDFGLARLTEHMTHTRLVDTEYLAPEVKIDPPQWTTLSDVFALAIMLRNLRSDKESSTPLGRVLSAAMDADVSKRLTPGRLASELAALSDRLNLESVRKDQEKVFAQRLRRFPSQLRWAHEVCKSYLPDMIASALGVFDDQEVLLCAASFLDDLFAGWYREQFPGMKPPHISSLDASQLPPTLHPFCHDQVLATGLLRHGRAHREKQRRNIENAIVRLALPNFQQPIEHLRRAVLNTSQRFEQAMPLSGLHDLVQAWVQGRKP